MAFSYTVDKKIPLRDPHGMTSSPAFIAIGTYTNAGGDAGGEIDTQGDVVLFASATDGTGANAIKVTINDSGNGKITLVTTDGDDGQWMAIVTGYV